MISAASRIRARRIEKGLSLAAAAKELAVSKATLSRIENEKQGVSDAMLPKIIALLDISPSDIRPDLAKIFFPDGEAADA